MAWCWYIPYKWHGVEIQNLPYFFSLAVSIHMNIQKLVHGAHVLVFTDISSALGWMHKAYFDTVKKGVHERVALWLGWKVVSNKVSL